MGVSTIQLHLSSPLIPKTWEDQLCTRVSFPSSLGHSLSFNKPSSIKLLRITCNTIDPKKEGGLETVKNVKGNVEYLGKKSEESGQRRRPRLLVVANRLPVSMKRKSDGGWSLDVSTGGLVSALLGVKQFETKWIGWAAVNAVDDVDREALTEALKDKDCIPVFLDDETADKYYNGYSNNVLWPLFHYLGLPQEERLSATQSLEDQFEAYKRANRIFANVIYENYKEGDVIWCHDYHLMFLPKFLKEYDRNMKVGWFLHIPFPSSEIYRTLPSRSELLKSLLMADIVGFHTYDYARHFVSACARILGLEGTPEGVEDEGRLTRVAAFPIGIDPERFLNALETAEVKNNIKAMKEEFAGRKVMLGVYRLDTIKGIPQKLLAFEKFLEENAQWRDKVILVQLAVPTRIDVPEYQRLTSQVHEIVGRINGRFGTLTNVPIHHLDRLLEFPKLCALYAVTDVLLVTSLRDGMNLVSYEYIACQNDKKGVLVLSEFAGAAQSLGAGAVLVNPWNINEVAVGIKDALEMEVEKKEMYHEHNFEYVMTHTAQSWADSFISELNDTIVEAELRRLRVPRKFPVAEAVNQYRKSKNRLIVLGCTETLATVESPLRAAHEKSKELQHHLCPDLHAVLTELCSDTATTVVIISGCKRSVLNEVFGQFNVWLVAENGMFLRHTTGDWIATMPKHQDIDWFESVKLVFEYFQERTPRSFVEVRETSLVWSYKYADSEFGRIQARDMLQHLWTGPISNAALDVIQGGKSVEVRAAGITKGSAIDRVLSHIAYSKHMNTPFDYVLCMGHFLIKDEDIYSFFEPDPSLRKKSNSNARLLDSKAFTERQLETKSAGSVSTKDTAALAVKISRFPQEIVENNGISREGSKKHWSSTQWNLEKELRGEGSLMLDLKGDTYYSIAVGRRRSNARYSLPSSQDVVLFLQEMSKSSNKLYTKIQPS